VKTSGNHQVQNKPKVIFEADRDALSDASQISNDLPFHIMNGWRHGAEQERAREAHALEFLPEDSRLQGLKIHDDVWQLRHAQYLVMYPAGRKPPSVVENAAHEFGGLGEPTGSQNCPIVLTDSENTQLPS